MLVADGSSGSIEKGENYSGVYMPWRLVIHALEVSIPYAIALVILLGVSIVRSDCELYFEQSI